MQNPIIILLMLPTVLLVRSVTSECQCDGLNTTHVTCTNCDTLDDVKLPTDILFLNISGNRLTEAPAVPCNSLQTLDISYNKMSSMGSKVFDTCWEITVFNISYNQLETVTKEGMHGLDFVEHLDISHNHIMYVLLHYHSSSIKYSSMDSSIR